MSCPKCGVQSPEGAAFCPACGQPLVSVERPEQSKLEESRGPVTPANRTPRVAYAGFWLRLVAFIIDSIVTIPVVIVVFVRANLINLRNPQPLDQAFLAKNPQLVFAAELTVFVLVGVYYSVMESSSWQATLGKRFLGLKVTDLAGRPLSFGRATARYFCKLISGFTFTIGYVMAAFTPRKQALHDLITECLVVRKV